MEKEKDYEENEGRIKKVFREIEEEDENEKSEKEVKRVRFKDGEGKEKNFLANLKKNQSEGYKNISNEIFRHFETDPSKIKDDKDFEKLQVIHKWAFAEGRTLDEGLKKLRELEIRLGYPTGRDSKWDKPYNFILMENKISDLKAKQDSLKGASWEVRSYLDRTEADNDLKRLPDFY